MKQYRVTSLPPGVMLDECVVARSEVNSGKTFIKTKTGEIFFAGQHYREIDLLQDFGSNAKDRSVYAKLAGITVKELDAARKAAKDRADKESKVFELRRLKSSAAKLGMKLVKA